MPSITPISTLIYQTAKLLQQDSPSETPFFGLIVVQNPDLLPLFQQENTTFTILSLTDFLAQAFSQYYDLAVLILDKQVKITPDTATAIQRCRDVFARHSVIFAPQPADFIAFGFSKMGQQSMPLGDFLYLAWQFNLYDYKQLPDWFNSRFWANPENWNKFRW